MKHIAMICLSLLLAASLTGCCDGVLNDGSFNLHGLGWSPSGGASALGGELELREGSSVEQTVHIAEPGSYRFSWRVTAIKGEPWLQVSGDFDALLGIPQVATHYTQLEVPAAGDYVFRLGLLQVASPSDFIRVDNLVLVRFGADACQ